MVHHFDGPNGPQVSREGVVVPAASREFTKELLYSRDKNAANEGRFATAAYTADGREAMEGNINVHGLDIVGTRSGQVDPLGPVHRSLDS